MFRASKRFQVAGLMGLAALALTGPRALGQRMQQAVMVRQFRPSSTTMGQNPFLFQQGQFGFNPNSQFGNFSLLGSPLNSFANPNLNAYGATGLAGGLYGASPALSQYSSLYGGNPYLSAYSGLYGSGSSGSSGAGYGSSGGGSAPESPEVNEQQARLLGEQVRAERVANRRRIFDENLYEREKTPSAEQERQRSQEEQLTRSRNNPPMADVTSGKALNDLLADLQLRAAKGSAADLRNRPMPLDEAGLQHINVSAGAGNTGLLKYQGRLTWPVALDGPDFQPDRERLSALAMTAVSQATFNGRADSGTIQQMSDDLVNLRKRLRGKVRDFSPSFYIEAKVFLNNFDSSIHALGQPDAGHHFTGKYALRSTTVAELVKHMTDHGLHFAPAVRGDEAAYEALHKALAAYDREAQAQTAAR